MSYNARKSKRVPILLSSHKKRSGEHSRPPGWDSRIKFIPPQGETYWTTRSIHDKKKDWEQESGTWIDGYAESKNHPHRQLIINALQKFEPIESILEIGCNCAPNLALIKEKISIADDMLFGIDVNSDVIKKAKELLPACNFQVGSVLNLESFFDKSFDIVISDAVLIYIDPQKIEEVISEIDRVTKRGIILVEWFDKSLEGVIKDFHWCRNYKKLLEKKGFKVEETKITKDYWQSRIWIKNGRLFMCRRQ